MSSGRLGRIVQVNDRLPAGKRVELEITGYAAPAPCEAEASHPGLSVARRCAVVRCFGPTGCIRTARVRPKLRTQGYLSLDAVLWCDASARQP
jgi:hypothetical protein